MYPILFQQNKLDVDIIMDIGVRNNKDKYPAIPSPF